MEDSFSVNHPFVTVQDAADLCDVSQTTIRSKIKEYKMKTYLDDKGRIHIRTLDVLLYYHKRLVGRVAKAEKELHKAIDDRNEALSEYYELAREHDDQLDGEDCAAIYVSECALVKKHKEMYDASHRVRQAIETLHCFTDFYNTIT